MISFVVMCSLSARIKFRKIRSDLDATSHLHQGQDQPAWNGNLMIRNKDIATFAALVSATIFSFTIALTVLLSSRAGVTFDNTTNANVYFYLFTDLVHPTAALIVYPTFRICSDFQSMKRYAKDLI